MDPSKVWGEGGLREKTPFYSYGWANTNPTNNDYYLLTHNVKAGDEDGPS